MLFLKKLESTLDATEISGFQKNAKAMITKSSETLYISALCPNQICSVLDEILTKRFDKLLERLLLVRWITDSSADHAAK